MSQLRDKENGCEWDKEQTFESIAPYTIEEAYEVADAIDRGNISELQEELGDLLLQVVFLSILHDVLAGTCRVCVSNPLGITRLGVLVPFYT